MAFSYSKSDLVIVFKNTSRANAKTRMKVFKNKSIDYFLDSLKTPKKPLVGIPKTAEILQIGLGTIFEAKYKHKYKL